MMHSFRSSILALSLACCGSALSAQSDHQTCPVNIDHVELSYKHNGGPSTPQLKLDFSNASQKRISTVAFNLSVLDSTGSPRTYPQNIIDHHGLDAGKEKTSTWDLDTQSVSIRRTGETVFVREIQFIDGTTWKDDGTESCDITLDYHPR